MLTIRKEQMKALAGYTRNNFELRMVAYLRETFPEQTGDLTEEKLISFVRQGMSKAEQYDILFENDIRRFLEYLMIYGFQMDTEAATGWIKDILRREALDGTAKMDIIDETELTLLRDRL